MVRSSRFIHNSLAWCLPLVLLASCASSGKKERQALRDYLVQQKYDEALALVNQSKDYNDKDSKLLQLVENGLIQHRAGRYQASIESLTAAKQLVEELYTVSISNKAQSWLANDSYDIYYGAKYEVSMIFFYLALNRYMLYQQGPGTEDGRKQLWAARAEILAWDSYLKTIQHSSLGKSVFKQDLMAKVFGGFIHEATNQRSDLQIALQLYQDALTLLFRNYNGYRSFNDKAVDFKRDFEKLPELDLAIVQTQYISPTEYQKALVDFLHYKILALSQQVRPEQYKQLIQQLQPSAAVLARVAETKKQASNVAVLVQRGLIPAKVPAKQYFGLGAVMEDPNASGGAKVMAGIGSIALTMFAADALGLTPPPDNWSPAGAYLGIKVAEAAVHHAAIRFELPMVDNKLSFERTMIKVFKGNVLIQQQELPVVDPLGDMAEESIAEDSAARYSRLGLRLATKHISAIAASYGTYKMLRGSDGRNDFLARNAAVIQYLGLSKGIEASESADTRYWSSLPGDLRMLHLCLAPGDYRIVLERHNDRSEVTQTVVLGDIKVVGDQKILISHQLF